MKPETKGSWEQRCAVLYQVIGGLANRFGVFETSDDVAGALDVACGRGDVEKLLPWPKDMTLGRPGNPALAVGLLSDMVSLLLGSTKPIGPMRDRKDYPPELQNAIDFLHGRVAQPEELSAELRRDSETLVRLIEMVKAMDMQATRIIRVEGDDEIIEGYRFNTGLWHRILGTIAGHACAKWIQTPEGKARIAEAADRAAATIEELDKARAINWDAFRRFRTAAPGSPHLDGTQSPPLAREPG